MRLSILLTASMALASASAGAASLSFEIHQITPQGVGAALGTITAHDGEAGLTLTPDLKGLPPGPHGFHVHENPACGPGEKDGKPAAGLAAGSHYDPKATGQHLGPQGAGHLGDLPVLTVAEDGSAKTAVTATRLHVADLAGRALVIHAEGDNYADKLGGGRIACGVAK